MKYTKPFTTAVKPLAHSEDLLGTSNSVFSIWGIQACLWVNDGKVNQEFSILDNWSVTKPWKVLFTSSSWSEIQEWIKEHESEIIEQINEESIKWIKKYYPNRLNEFVPESPIMIKNLFRLKSE